MNSITPCRSSRTRINFHNFCFESPYFRVKCYFFAIRRQQFLTSQLSMSLVWEKTGEKKMLALRFVFFWHRLILSPVSFHPRAGLSWVRAAGSKSISRNERARSVIFDPHLHKMTEASRLSKAFNNWRIRTRIKPAHLLLIDAKIKQSCAKETVDP